MNILSETIQNFSNQELRQFIYFLKRNGQDQKEREDLKIVKQIRQGTMPQMAKTNAQRQTLKRLKNQLQQFVVIENMRTDQSSEVIGTIEMAKYLFRKNLYKNAWDCLIKAEKLAIEREEYELLDFIYYIQISRISVGYDKNAFEPDTIELLRKRSENFQLAKKDGDANSAHALIIYKIENMFTQKLKVDMDDLVTQILKKV